MDDLQKIEQFICAVADFGYLSNGKLEPYQIQQFSNVLIRMFEELGVKMVDRKLQNPTDTIKALLVELESDANSVALENMGTAGACDFAAGVTHATWYIDQWLTEEGYGSAHSNRD